MSTLVFVHGQGVKDSEAADAYLTKLRPLLPSLSCSAVAYGPTIERNWFLPFAAEPTESTEVDSKAERDLLYLQAHWDTLLGLTDEKDWLEPSGRVTDDPLKAVRDTWLY